MKSKAKKVILSIIGIVLVVTIVLIAIIMKNFSGTFYSVEQKSNGTIEVMINHNTIASFEGYEDFSYEWILEEEETYCQLFMTNETEHVEKHIDVNGKVIYEKMYDSKEELKEAYEKVAK